MIRAAIFETDPASRALLREWIVRCLVRTDMELELLWFTKETAKEKLDKYVKTVQLALISLDAETARSFGRSLYRMNPECRICYYRTKPCDLEPLLDTRPAAFFLWKRGEEAFQNCLTGLLRELTDAKDMFFYEDRKGITCIPYARILYLQSDLKHAEVVTDSGEALRFFSKLSQLEQLLDGRFLRIHKSYIVNIRFVEAVDRKRHEVRLTSGDALPVSDTWYEKTLESVRKLKDEGGDVRMAEQGYCRKRMKEGE